MINKSENEANVTDNKSTEEITSFSEQSAVKVLAPRGTVSQLEMPNPYPGESLTAWLQRPYPVAEYLWTSSSLEKLGVINFPDALFTVPGLMRKLDNHHYFRAGVRITVRINGTRFHYGKLLVAYRPNVDIESLGDYEYQMDQVLSMSACPGFMLSPTNNDITSMVIPYAMASP